MDFAAYWWALIPIIGALTWGIAAIIGAAKSQPVDSKGNPVVTGSHLQPIVDQQAISINRMQAQIDSLEARVAKIEGLLREVD